jgi:hypothetical protein
MLNMTPPAVSAPPPPAASRAEAPAPAPELRARPPFSRIRPERPGLLTGRTLGISVALHVIFFIAILLAPKPERPNARASAVASAQGSQEMVEYVEVGDWGGMATDPSASLPEPAAATGISAAAADSILSAVPEAGPFPQRVPTGIPGVRSGPAAGQPGSGGPGAGGAAGGQPGAAGQGRTGMGRLSPELGDPRLVVRPSAVPEAPIEDVDRYQRHIRGRIQALNDSISGEADRQRGANDWTFTDRNGRRWGIDERGVVAGGKHVPTPQPGFGRPQRDREDEARRERDQRREIDRQAETIERERHLRERGEAMRERENQRRREEQEKQGGTTP